MSNQKTFRRTAIVVALSVIFPATFAVADEVDDLINPNVADFTFKLPYQDRVNPLYRQYNGINQNGFNPSLDFEFVRRSQDGEWIKAKARDIGLSTVEFGASYEVQGNWAIGVEYNQIPHYSPYEIKTAVGGIGTNTITQPSYANSAFSGGVLTNASLSDTTLKTERDITTLTAKKYILDSLKFEFTFKNEDKTGVRLDSVRGVAGTGTPNRYSGFLFAPEPISQNHQQFEATVDYVTSKLQLSAGYYGSFLTTKDDYLRVIGGTNTAAVTTGSGGLSPISLSPDNQSQQLFFKGAYNFTQDTRANVKLAYSEGRQTANYLWRSDVNAGIGDNLDAKVQTTEMFASLSSRVTKDLNLLGSWRYEDKVDKTPVRLFYTGYPNNPESHTANWGKLEANYRLGSGYSVSGGVDYAQKRSLEWERHEVEELTWRTALRKSMSETVNGTLSFAHANRIGSEWEGSTAPSLYPVYLANRQRNKVRGSVDWTPMEQLNLQVAYEAFFDNYTKSTYGLSSGQGQVFSLDASYSLNDTWKLNAWYAKQVGETQQNMQGAVCTGTGTCASGTTTFRTGTLVQWSASLNQDSDQFGFGLNGKVYGYEVGVQYLFSHDKTRQDISNMPTTTCLNASCSSTGVVTTGMGVIPDASYTQNTFKLYGAYQLSKATKLRLDYIYDLRMMDDYTWENWVYADGTKVYVNPHQRTQVLGLSVTQSF